MTVLAVRHVTHEGLGLLEKVFEAEGISYEYLDARQGPFPSVDLSRYAGLVVLGGAMGVYETGRYPFLSKEMGLLREALQKEVPTLPPPNVTRTKPFESGSVLGGSSSILRSQNR